MPATYPPNDGVPVRGAVAVHGCGRLELAWDNGTTWLGRSNTLSYSVVLEYKVVDARGRLAHNAADGSNGGTATASGESKRGRRGSAGSVSSVGGVDGVANGHGAGNNGHAHAHADAASGGNGYARDHGQGDVTDDDASASSPTAQGTNGEVLSSDDKVTRIFKFFDKDGDDVLNLSLIHI